MRVVSRKNEVMEENEHLRSNKELEENKCIREKPYKVKVKPIKGDVGTIMGLDGSHPVKGWQPTARELVSESWEVME